MPWFTVTAHSASKWDYRVRPPQKPNHDYLWVPPKEKEAEIQAQAGGKAWDRRVP